MIKNVSVLLVFITLCSFGEVLTKVYHYEGSAYDTKATARLNALKEAEQILLKEASKLIVSKEMLHNDKYSEDVTVVSAGIVKTKITHEDWDKWRRKKLLTITISTTIDIKDAQKKAKAIVVNKSLMKQLAYEQKESQKALASVKDLTKRLLVTENELEKAKLYRELIGSQNRLAANDWFKKGLDAEERGFEAEALCYYSSALTLHAGHAYAYNNRGNMLLILGDTSMAQNEYNNALRLIPDLAPALYNKANIIKESSAQRAIELYNKAIDSDSTMINIYFNRANTYRAMNEIEKAKLDYKKFITLSSKSKKYLQYIPKAKEYLNQL